MWQVSKRRNILSSWMIWHYGVALKLIYQRWRDFLRFTADYFSLRFLLRTIFSPWRRYNFSYGRGFDFRRYLETLVFNVFSRIIGFFFRSFVIVAGLFSQFFVVVGGILIIILWLLLPVVTVVLFFYSFTQY